MALDRRRFLKRTLAGAGIVLGAGGLPLALRATRLRPLPPGAALRCFTPAEYSIVADVADRMLAGLPADQPTPEQVGVALKADALMALSDPDTQKDFKQLLGLFDNALAGFLFDGRTAPFSALDAAAQDRALRAWRDSRLPLRRSGFQGLRRLCLAMYYSDPRSYPSLGYPGPPLLVRADGSAVGGTAEDRAAYRASLRETPQ